MLCDAALAMDSVGTVLFRWLPGAHAGRGASEAGELRNHGRRERARRRNDFVKSSTRAAEARRVTRTRAQTPTRIIRTRRTVCALTVFKGQPWAGFRAARFDRTVPNRRDSLMKMSKVARRFAPSLALASMALVPVLTVGALELAPAAPAAKAKVGRPTVATGGSTQVRATSATLVGSVDPNSAVTTYYFQYGPTITYGKQTTPGTLAAGTARIKVGQQVTGLLTGYHYRLVASNQYGITPGRDKLFTTAGATAPKFTIPKSKTPTVYGATFVLSGVLGGAGSANRTVTLQSSPYPFLAPFATAGTAVLTDAAGRFTFRVPRLLTSTQFRISTLDPRPVYSPIVTQRASVRVTLRVKTTSHKGLVRLYGTVTPAKVGAPVLFQLRKAVRPEASPKRKPASRRRPRRRSSAAPKPFRASAQSSRSSMAAATAPTSRCPPKARSSQAKARP